MYIRATDTEDGGNTFTIDSVTACLEERLGADIAAAAASGAIPLNEEEERLLGDCLPQEALGGSP